MTTTDIFREAPVELRAYGDQQLLVCPLCESENLHQCAVHIFNRDKEDGDDTAETYPNPDVGLWAAESGSPAESPVGNPSSRRQGLHIEFWCEGCGAGGDKRDPRLLLSVAQHKGSTLLNWTVFLDGADAQHARWLGSKLGLFP